MSNASCLVLGCNEVAGVVGEGCCEEEKALRQVVRRGRMVLQLMVLDVMALQERRMVSGELCRV